MQIKNKWEGKNTKNLLIQEPSPGLWELLENWKRLFTQIKYLLVAIYFQKILLSILVETRVSKEWFAGIMGTNLFLFSLISHQIRKRKQEK